jgi:putative PIN family toxin of toxin-antitoxin system
LRAVLDPNVLISALLSPEGAPARVVVAWQQGRFELVVSDELLDELERALSYPKLRERITADEAAEMVAWLRRVARTAADVPDPPARSANRNDDYLIALAESERAALVSGDGDVLALTRELPVFTASRFLEFLDRQA